jgi:hypothetical protein
MYIICTINRQRSRSGGKPYGSMTVGAMLSKNESNEEGIYP